MNGTEWNVGFKKDSPFANSGLVVNVNENDWSNYKQVWSFSWIRISKGSRKICF